MSREDVEKIGQGLGEEEVMPRVIALLHGLDDTRAQVIRLDPDILVMYARAITVAAQPIGLPVMVKRHIRLNALTQPPSP